MSDSQVYCTVKMAAYKLGLTYTRVRQLILSGHIPAARYGPHWMLAVADVEQYAAAPESRRLKASVPQEIAKQNPHPAAEAIYQYLVEFKENNAGESPTRREIVEAVGITSTSMVNVYLKQLEENGKIKLTRPGKSRMIHIPGGVWKLEDGDGQNGVNQP